LSPTAYRLSKAMLWILLLSLGLLQGFPTTLASKPHPLVNSRSLPDEADSSSPSRLQIVEEEPPGQYDHTTAYAALVPLLSSDRLHIVNALLFLFSQTLLAVHDREERSPRRCLRLQESCLDQKLPCCDACAICYCRFFKANCYCKRIGNASSCGRN
uniref:Agouti domain-containing protein n=1 Tax=Salvator merianae TaxID=96440 RepID=A0A8D0BAZ4_SALMN